MEIREANMGDLDGLLELYTYLKTEDAPPREAAEAAMEAIVRDPNHHLLVGIEGGRIVSSCAAVVIPNLTRGCRSYMLIENVVTEPGHRGQGCATAMLARACALGEEAGCYKAMLLTGSKREETLRFYRNAGFNSEDKTAFIRWLGDGVAH